jgi:hypothetical protein
MNASDDKECIVLFDDFLKKKSPQEKVFENQGMYSVSCNIIMVIVNIWLMLSDFVRTVPISLN